MDKQETWDSLILMTVKLYESQSKCAAKHVCAIVAEETSSGYNILSIGLNGTPSGHDNCSDIWEKRDGKWFNKRKNEFIENGHKHWSEAYEIHAEVNSISKCNARGISVKGNTMFISYSPCLHCAKMLVAFGIKRVVFINKFDDFDDIVSGYLISNGITCHQYSENLTPKEVWWGVMYAS